MKYFIQMILALFTLAVMGWVVWQIFQLLRKEQLGLDATARPVVIIFSALVLIFSFMVTVAIGNHSDKYFRSQQFPLRLDMYEKCVAVWDTINQEFSQGLPVRVDIQVRELESQLSLLASAKALKAFQELKRVSKIGAVNSMEALEARKKMILAMREDLGQPSDYLLRKELQNLIK